MPKFSELDKVAMISEDAYPDYLLVNIANPDDEGATFTTKQVAFQNVLHEIESDIDENVLQGFVTYDDDFDDRPHGPGALYVHNPAGASSHQILDLQDLVYTEDLQHQAESLTRAGLEEMRLLENGSIPYSALSDAPDVDVLHTLESAGLLADGSIPYSALSGVPETATVDVLGTLEDAGLLEDGMIPYDVINGAPIPAPPNILGELEDAGLITEDPDSDSGWKLAEETASTAVLDAIEVLNGSGASFIPFSAIIADSNDATGVMDYLDEKNYVEGELRHLGLIDDTGSIPYYKLTGMPESTNIISALEEADILTYKSGRGPFLHTDIACDAVATAMEELNDAGEGRHPFIHYGDIIDPPIESDTLEINNHSIITYSASGAGQLITATENDVILSGLDNLVQYVDDQFQDINGHPILDLPSYIVTLGDNSSNNSIACNGHIILSDMDEIIQVSDNGNLRTAHGTDLYTNLSNIVQCTGDGILIRGDTSVGETLINLQDIPALEVGNEVSQLNTSSDTLYIPRFIPVNNGTFDTTTGQVIQI